ncbi:MAG: VPLPA-CTERM sorting domain-containing protein [Pseudomonadota bacterium]
MATSGAIGFSTFGALLAMALTASQTSALEIMEPPDFAAPSGFPVTGPTQTLAPGITTIRGATMLSETGLVLVQDEDAVFVALEPGDFITKLTITVDNIERSGDFSGFQALEAEPLLFTPVFVVAAGDFGVELLTATNGSMAMENVSVGAGTYFFDLSPSLSLNRGQDFEISYDYVVDVSVRSSSQAPLPASLPLLLGGLAGVAALRRRASKAPTR